MAAAEPARKTSWWVAIGRSAPVRLLRRLSVPREGIYYLTVMGFVAGGAIMRQINLLILLFGMLSGPLLFNLWCAVTMLRKLQVRRTMPHTITAGDPLLVAFEIENTSKRGGSWTVVVQDQLFLQQTNGPTERHQPAVLFSHVPAGAVRHGTYRGQLQRRGRYQLGPVRLSTRFPFGLIRYQKELDVPDELIVFPREGQLAPRWQQLWQSAQHERLRKPQCQRTRVEGEFHGLRTWHAGDSRRWIHWRTTARRGELMVRQFEQPRQPDLVLLVDPWQPANADLIDRELVERTISFAATVISELTRQGAAHLVLGITGPQPQVMHGPTTHSFSQAALTQLAVTGAHSQTDLMPLLDAIAPHLRYDQRVVVISSLPDDEDDLNRWQTAITGHDAADLLGGALYLDVGSELWDELISFAQ